VAIPDNTRRMLAHRLATHRHQRWPTLTELSLRYRGNFVYLTTTDFTGDPLPLCRLTYRNNAEYWGFAIYRASRDAYENSILPNGTLAGTPEQALDCACGLYLNDPTAWT
jgi:hypothetical protein